MNKKSNYFVLSLFVVYILEAKYPVFPGFFNQSVGIMQN